jgi:hypothetical protein
VRVHGLLLLLQLLLGSAGLGPACARLSEDSGSSRRSTYSQADRGFESSLSLPQQIARGEAARAGVMKEQEERGERGQSGGTG